MKIVIPMAGKGLRFGCNPLPKPLIPVCGHPMFYWAVKSLPKLYDDFIFICRSEHIAYFHLDRVIREYFGNEAAILEINHETMGQACTVREAAYLFHQDALLVHNTDTCFECDFTFLSRTDIHGAIPHYPSIDPQMSFVSLDASGRVTNVAEKKPISSNATVGAYYFTHGQDFIEALDLAIANDQSVRGEYYIAPLYNTLIKQGKHIIGVPSSNVHDLGTPEKLEKSKYLLQISTEVE